jgi:hypothetical protein
MLLLKIEWYKSRNNGHSDRLVYGEQNTKMFHVEHFSELSRKLFLCSMWNI